jgi:GINS complex subunit 2
MALPLPPGLTPTEVAFLCEMEMVTVIPRQRLETLNIISVTLPLQPRVPQISPPFFKSNFD